MLMKVRFSTIVFVGLQVAKESDHKTLFTVLKEILENIPPYISRLLLILNKK